MLGVQGLWDHTPSGELLAEVSPDIGQKVIACREDEKARFLLGFLFELHFFRFLQLPGLVWSEHLGPGRQELTGVHCPKPENGLFRGTMRAFRLVGRVVER